MTEKELKKLNRRQLLELLILQTDRADQLQRQLDEARANLEERSIAITQSGSLAEAALKLSGIFEAADAAAQTFLENLRQQTQRTEQIEQEAAQRAQAMIEDAERKCREREQAADEYYLKVDARIRKQSELLNELFGGGRNKS